jgi:hypothetical protein
MIDEYNLVSFSWSEGDPYKSSQASELTAVPGGSAWRLSQRDAFRMEDRLHRRRRQRLHFEMVRHSEMECVQGCIRAPLRSSADRRSLTLDDLNLGSDRSEAGFDCSH